jgi:hypothetical protein
MRNLAEGYHTKAEIHNLNLASFSLKGNRRAALRKRKSSLSQRKGQKVILFVVIVVLYI